MTRRLKQEIMHWDHRAQELKAQERAGKRTRLSSENAQRRADDLADRLQARLAELERERAISALPPVVQGGALIVPVGLLRARRGEATPPDAAARAEVERLAMAAVMQAERRLGFEPRGVSAENRGYDVESYDGAAGQLRLIEVNGRAPDSDAITVTRNEILCALNANDRYILAIVEVDGGGAREPRYLRRPFERESDRRASSINYPKSTLLRDATRPT